MTKNLPWWMPEKLWNNPFRTLWTLFAMASGAVVMLLLILIVAALLFDPVWVQTLIERELYGTATFILDLPPEK